METRVQRWGNSLALRIPKPLAEEVGLENDTPVHLTLQGKTLIIKPVRSAADRLEAYLALINDTNIHGEVPSGDAQGGEVW